MAQAIVNKLLHGPTARLKEAASSGDGALAGRGRGAVRHRGGGSRAACRPAGRAGAARRRSPRRGRVLRLQLENPTEPL